VKILESAEAQAKGAIEERSACCALEWAVRTRNLCLIRSWPVFSTRRLRPPARRGAGWLTHDSQVGRPENHRLISMWPAEYQEPCSNGSMTGSKLVVAINKTRKRKSSTTRTLA